MVDREGAGRSRVFCFGIGNDVNTRLLDRITETTRATSAYVLPEEDLEIKLSAFFAKIKEPVLANLKLAFPDGLRTAKLYPATLPDLFKGEQLILAGRYAGRAEGKLVLEGSVEGRSQSFAFDARFPETSAEHDFIPRLWATRRIGYLLDEIRLRGENAELRDEVVSLARQYGVVTPYTAYLIHEDEQRRGVPLAQQSLPQFGADRDAYRLAEGAYRAYRQDTSGQGAVAAARYGIANKSANQVADFLQVNQADSARALSFAAAAPAPASAGVPVAAGPAGATGRGTVNTLARGAPAPAAGSAPVAQAAVAKVIEYTQQTRFAGGRNFFQNGNQWVDTRVQQLKTPDKQRVQFNSTEYFNLVLDHPESRPWLALGANVVFAVGNTVFEVYE
jgi:Ca-activated chloride channel family protein